MVHPNVELFKYHDLIGIYDEPSEHIFVVPNSIN